MRKALVSDMTPDTKLNERLIRKWDALNSESRAVDFQFGKEGNHMKKRKFASMAAAAAVCVLAVSTTAVAAVKYLSKDEIVSQIGDDAAIEAVSSDGTLELNETLEAGDYRFKLYAAATKEEMDQNGFGNDLSNEGGTYVILAIERLDGTPMPDTGSEEYGNFEFFVSPLIQGLEPWQYNVASMGGGHSTIVRDGVLYRIIECDDITVFADRRIYLCITDTAFYPAEAYHYNETDGTITRNEDYGGINLLVDLPLDPGRADEAKALAYLKELEASWKPEPKEETVGEEGIVLTECVPFDEAVRKEHEKNPNVRSWKDIPLETLLGYGVLEEASVQEVTEKDGKIEFGYVFEDGSGSSGVGFLTDDFLDGTTDICITGWGCTSESAQFDVVRREEDGTLKWMIYVIK